MFKIPFLPAWRKLAVAAVSAAVALLVCVGSAPAAEPAAGAPHAPALEKVRALVQPSVVYLTTTWTAHIYDTRYQAEVSARPVKVTLRCSGFFVSPEGHIVTAGHCAQYDDDVRAGLIDAAVEDAARTGYYVDRGSGAPVRSLKRIHKLADVDWVIEDRERDIDVTYGVAAAGLATGRTLPARLLGLRKAGGAGVKEAGDVALVKIDGEDLPALSVSRADDLEVGTQMVSVGYPASVDLVTDATFDPSFKQGTVSSVKTIDNGLLRVFEVNAAVSGGMSGGPAVDLQGRVIGVNSFGIVGEPQPFNFIRPSSLILELLQDKGVRNETGPTNATYRAGVQAYFRGDRAVALQKLGAVLDEVPSHALAQEYRAKARRLRPRAATGAALDPVIGVAVAFALALVLLAVRRRRGRSLTTAPGGRDQATEMHGDTKVCVECAETIKAAARVCRYCGCRLDEAEYAETA